MYTPTFSFRSGADADFVDINPLVGDVSISGGFKVDGGTSSGFLKADGSIDTTTYSTGGGSFLPLAGGSLTGALHVDQSGGSYKLNVGATANGSIYTEGRIFSLGSIDTDSNITSNGKMTLGTNTVHTTDSVLSIEDLSSSISGIQFNANSAAYNRLWEVYNTSNAKRMGLVYDNANIRLHFVDRSEGELMTIMESGNIGINRTSPSYQLDVNGTFRASSSAYFAGTFGNLDTTSDTGINFELGTSALNTMRTDADAFRIYFGGTSANGESLKITQAGLMTLKTQGSTEFQWDLDGDFHADGDVIAYSTTVSDRRLKENITTIESATETVKQLRGVQYDWKAGSGTREGQTEIGLIAQEVEEVLPFLVREKTLMRGEEVKTVDYEKLVGLLIESNKELSSRIDELEKR